MAFQNLIARADRFSLAQFAEPVTLEFETTSLTVSAVVDILAENSLPLISGDAKSDFCLTLATAIAAAVTPEWTATVRGQRRPVLENIPDGTGLSTIWLGDPEED